MVVAIRLGDSLESFCAGLVVYPVFFGRRYLADASPPMAMATCRLPGVIWCTQNVGGKLEIKHG
jgi:hypothetical protein